MTKENDWFAANLGNPDFSPEDFKSIGGLSIDNTQFLSREEYKNKPKVKEIFTDENGKFDEICNKYFSVFSHIAQKNQKKRKKVKHIQNHQMKVKKNKMNFILKFQI